MLILVRNFEHGSRSGKYTGEHVQCSCCGATPRGGQPRVTAARVHPWTPTPCAPPRSSQSPPLYPFPPNGRPSAGASKLGHHLQEAVQPPA